VLATLAAIAFGAAPRSVTKTVPGASTLVVAAEGESEARSAGSYSLRVYAGTDRRFPYDVFVAGTLRRRHGTLESILFPDLDSDGSPEIVVVTRAVGSGGFLAADAFRLRGTTLALVGSVYGLAKDADPVGALIVKVGQRTYRGRMFWGHEVRAFKPCGSQSAYWVQAEGKPLKVLRDRSEKRGKIDQPLYVEAVGAIDTQSKRDGFARDYEGLFHLRSLARVSEVVPKNCG
jgi:hypothetical protein